MLTALVGNAAECAAQATFSYDAAGNRIKAVVMSTKKAMKPQHAEPLEEDMAASVFEAPAEDALNDASIKIYPNPTKGMLRVDIDGIDFSNGDRIEIYDGNGRTMNVTSNLIESNTIDLSDATNGTYIMRITLGSESTTWHIIKE